MIGASLYYYSLGSGCNIGNLPTDNWSLIVQKIVYAILSPNLSVPVYDDAPQDQPLPVVSIGEDTIEEWGTDIKRGVIATITIHSWSDYDGRKEVKQIMGDIYNLLHRRDYVISGYTVLDSAQEYEQTITENDGITRHGVQRFRMMIIEE